MQLFQINQSEDSSKITIKFNNTCDQLHQRSITTAPTLTTAVHSMWVPSSSLCGPLVWWQCSNPQQGNNIFTVYCPPLTTARVPSLQIPDNNIILLSYYRNQSIERSAQTLMSYSLTIPHTLTYTASLDRSCNPTPHHALVYFITHLGLMTGGC